MQNISTAFKYSKSDAELITKVLISETYKQIDIFQTLSNQLTDYAYWYLLSTLWVNDSSIAPLSIWKELFSVKRPNRRISIMKPDELSAFKKLPNKLTLYRVHTKEENDWISYTLSLKTAKEFARRKRMNEVVEYKAKKHDCQALFLRREETEVICLNKNVLKRKSSINLI